MSIIKANFSCPDKKVKDAKNVQCKFIPLSPPVNTADFERKIIYICLKSLRGLEPFIKNEFMKKELIWNVDFIRELVEGLSDTGKRAKL